MRALFERLDILVNDVWGGDRLTEWGTPFWEHSLDNGLEMIRNGIETHIITSWYAAPLLVASDSGLVIEMTDGDQTGYRGSLFYDLVKASVIRLALAQGSELAPHGGTAIAVTPRWLRSERILEREGVTEDNWRDAVLRLGNGWLASETPHFVARAVVALATDPDVTRWTGQAVASWDLARDYGFTEIDGRRPCWPDRTVDILDDAGNLVRREDYHD